jgi:branched-chain amino acid transport system substrate-binding protein
LHDRELYGKGIADIVQKTAKKVGIEVVGFEGIDAKASNYKSLVVKMKQSGADLIYFGGTTQSNAGQLAKDIRSGGITAKLMVPDGCFEDAFITAAGAENLNGNTYLTFSGVPAKMLTGKGASFYENYKARFKSEPEVYSVYGYETARVILDAIQRANSSDRDAILQALAKTANYEGALGTWSFDENGDTTLKTLSGNTVKEGHFEFVRMLDGQ